MYYYLQQALPRVLIHLTRALAVEKKWNLRVRFSPLLRRTVSIRRGLTACPKVNSPENMRHILAAQKYQQVTSYHRHQ